MSSRKPKKPRKFHRFLDRVRLSPPSANNLPIRLLERLAFVHHHKQRRLMAHLPEIREREARRYRESREALGLITPVK